MAPCLLNYFYRLALPVLSPAVASASNGAFYASEHISTHFPEIFFTDVPALLLLPVSFIWLIC